MMNAARAGLRPLRGLLAGLALSFLAGGCTATLDPASPDELYHASDYFWTGQEQTLTYVQNATTHTLTLSTSGNVTTAYESVTGGGPASLDTLLFHTGGDSVSVEHLRMSSLIELPGDTHFCIYDSVRDVGEYHPTALTRIENTTLVGTDSGGVFEFDHLDSFAYRGLHGVKQITALAGYSASGVTQHAFAGNSAGDIFEAAAPLTSWSAVSAAGLPANRGAAIAMIADERGVLSVAFAGAPGIYQYASGAWTLTPLLPTKSVTALANVNQMLLAGTRTGDIGTLTRAGVATVNTFDCQQVNGFANYPAQAKVLAATDMGVYEASVSLLGKWSAAAWAVTPSTTRIAPVYAIAAAGGPIYLSSPDGVYYMTTGTAPVLVTVPDSLIPLTAIALEAHPLFLSRIGYAASQPTSTSWTVYHKGLTFGWPDVEGGLMLLKGGMQVNSSWYGGTLTERTLNDRTHVAHHYTARVLSHLDKLDLDESHPDVLVVRYAKEDSIDSLNSVLPYWVIYYQKHAGPVLIEERQPGSDKSLQTRIKQ